MQTELEIVDMKNPVSWCFTPSQPVRLYQGDMKNPKSDKYCIVYILFPAKMLWSENIHSGQHPRKK